MTADDLDRLISAIPKRKRRFVEIMVSRATDAGLTIGSPASDRASWNYPIVRAEHVNECVLTLRWVAENRP